jgi:hypothetical protein
MSDNKWKVVPAEPTEEMVAAGDDCWMMSRGNASGYWRAMLAAAPSPAAEGLEVVAYRFRCAGSNLSWLFASIPASSEYAEVDPLVRQSDAARLIAERDAEVETLKACLFQAQAAAKDLVSRLADMELARTEPAATVRWGRDFGAMEFTGSAELSGLLGRYSHDSIVRLYAAPPDAAEIIAKLTQERDESQDSRQREHDLRAKLAGDVEGYRAEVERLTAELAAANERIAALPNCERTLAERNAARRAALEQDAARWIDPNDKTQKQYLPWVGEPVLFCHEGKTYYGKHTGGSFISMAAPLGKVFGTWDCFWMYPPKAIDAARKEAQA